MSEMSYDSNILRKEYTMWAIVSKVKNTYVFVIGDQTLPELFHSVKGKYDVGKKLFLTQVISGDNVFSEDKKDLSLVSTWEFLKKEGVVFNTDCLDFLNHYGFSEALKYVNKINKESVQTIPEIEDKKHLPYFILPSMDIEKCKKCYPEFHFTTSEHMLIATRKKTSGDNSYIKLYHENKSDELLEHFLTSTIETIKNSLKDYYLAKAKGLRRSKVIPVYLDMELDVGDAINYLNTNIDIQNVIITAINNNAFLIIQD